MIVVILSEKKSPGAAEWIDRQIDSKIDRWIDRDLVAGENSAAVIYVARQHYIFSI